MRTPPPNPKLCAVCQDLEWDNACEHCQKRLCAHHWHICEACGMIVCGKCGEKTKDIHADEVWVCGDGCLDTHNTNLTKIWASYVKRTTR